MHLHLPTKRRILKKIQKHSFSPPTRSQSIFRLSETQMKSLPPKGTKKSVTQLNELYAQ